MNFKPIIFVSIFAVLICFCIFGCTTGEVPPISESYQASFDLVHKPYFLNTGLVSRSISFENTTGTPGEGGKAASPIGTGRKGAPMQMFKPDSMVVLCDINGPGTIRHIWMAGMIAQEDMRSIVIRAYWEEQTHPSIECPLGDFMGYAHGKVMAYQSAVHSCGENNAMNIWLPMPFVKNARITLTNDGKNVVPLYYQIDYTTGDTHPDDVGRLHVLFRRENLTTLKQDFTILPGRKGRGRYIGAVLGIRYEDRNWWGEGEIKIYMDGDTDFPTICGTGSEDYVCLSYGMQQTPFLYHGCSLNDQENGYVSMYRWHLPDPVYWQTECRITIQQIGMSPERFKGHENELPVNYGLYERQDDWSAATFWYEPVPSDPLPMMPDVEARTADLIE